MENKHILWIVLLLVFVAIVTWAFLSKPNDDPATPTFTIQKEAPYQTPDKTINNPDAKM